MFPFALRYENREESNHACALADLPPQFLGAPACALQAGAFFPPFFPSLSSLSS